MQVEEIKIERKETFVRILLGLFFKDKCPERIGRGAGCNGENEENYGVEAIRR